MKRLFLVLALIPALFLSAPAYAEYLDKNHSTFFVIPDILIYRPIGIAVTAVGVGLFVATSPLTAIAQISPPHDAFEKMSDILIKAPGRYTFSRPAGNLSLTDY